ncbi:MAG: carbohydrate kinase [Verrucomicrobiae bacterium]
MKNHQVLAVGEILWDLLPSGKQLGGAPANFAYHAHALGAGARLISRVGNDPLGLEILDRLRTLGLPTGGVSVDPAAPTGTVSVEIQPDGQPRFIIQESVAWDRLEAGDPVQADAVCFGTLGQRCATARQAIRAAVSAVPAGALRVFDINLRQQFYSREIIESSLALADALKLNDTELPVLAGMFDLAGEPRSQLDALAGRYQLRAVALTRGANGSLLLGGGVWSDHPGLSVKVVDAVGAGDAFTAAWTLGLLARHPLDKINQRANEIAAFVCTQPGATPVYPNENL